MAILNHDTKEIVFKLVYGGPAMSGKATNLQFLHHRAPQSDRGGLVLLGSSEDRTLHFELLVAAPTQLEGYRVRFRLYTVPGPVAYNATRQLVLRGADGLVFVADSRPEAFEGNRRAFEQMEANLAINGIRLDGIPLVLQYNKRDIPEAVPVEYLERSLNVGPRRLPALEAVAREGFNVFATLNAVSQLVVQRFEQVVEENSLASAGSCGTLIAIGHGAGRGRRGSACPKFPDNDRSHRQGGAAHVVVAGMQHPGGGDLG